MTAEFYSIENEKDLERFGAQKKQAAFAACLFRGFAEFQAVSPIDSATAFAS